MLHNHTIHDAKHIQWYPEIEQYERKTDPVFVLGFEEDFRQDPKTIEKLGKNNQVPLTMMKVSKATLEKHAMISTTNAGDRVKR